MTCIERPYTQVIRIYDVLRYEYGPAVPVTPRDKRMCALLDAAATDPRRVFIPGVGERFARYKDGGYRYYLTKEEDHGINTQG